MEPGASADENMRATAYSGRGHDLVRFAALVLFLGALGFVTWHAVAIVEQLLRLSVGADS